LVPTETALIANVAPFALRLGVETTLCLLVAAYFGGVRWWSLLMLAPILASLVAMAVGVGLILGFLYTYTQDVEQIWNVVSRLFFFVTPVFYDIESTFPAAQALIYWANPVTPILIAMRACLTPVGLFPVGAWAHGVLAGLLTLGLGYATYLRFEDWIEENA
jgi:ABC-type polysaccharide/polyol phosphate export permease